MSYLPISGLPLNLWQQTLCPGSNSRIMGFSFLQISIQSRQRAWKAQPGGTLTGLGISPWDIIFSGFNFSSASVATGMEDSNICV